MFFLEHDEVRDLNRLVVEFSGGDVGYVNEGNLFHVCDSAKRVSGGVVKVAAYYLYHFAYTAHAFTDGNKRTALEAMISYLILNGYFIKTNDEELVGLALMTAKGEKSLGEVEQWIKVRLKRQNKPKTIYG